MLYCGNDTPSVAFSFDATRPEDGAVAFESLRHGAGMGVFCPRVWDIMSFVSGGTLFE
jgi:hypothetical protein